MGSSLPADPGACTILASSNASAGDVPEQPAKRKRGQKTKTLADVKAGMGPIIPGHCRLCMKSQLHPSDYLLLCLHEVINS